ncbi:MAG: hypothetical protein QOE46_2932 [Acidobacteriota bacterium]|nr:hypothetical protein [Acidobacteriota bacterium]
MALNNHTGELASSDLEKLAESFITPELAQQAGLFRVDSAEGARLVGRNGGRDYSGIIFPYTLPGCDSTREYRLRRDKPELEQKADGTLKEKDKYLSPPGRGNLLYFVPGISPECLKNRNLPVAITEGEKKTLALYRLAQHESQGLQFMPVGLGGVWNWRGVISKANDEKGVRRDVKGVISDFSLITWNGRTVFIIFDSNVATNDSVSAARLQLGNELKRRGATVHFVDLPQIDGLNGVDDLLGIKGPEYVLSLIEAAEPHTEEKPARKTQATTLVELASDAKLFRTPEGDAYATVNVGGHLETWLLRLRGFQDWLRRRFYEAEGSAPSAQSLQEALDVLQGRAQFDGETREVYTRVAEHDGAIYLDLCDERWRVVHVTQDGWQVLENSPVRFRRAKGMLPLPEPARGGRADLLRNFVNVSTEDWPLLAGWLAATYRPGKPFPLLALHGEQGSAKSTTAKVLRSLIDPNKADLRSEPREERDLMIAAKNGWLITLDNLSHIKPWLSDALCRLATGGGFAVRQNYTDDEEIIIEAKRPILLNGIEELATRSDLLERAIVLILPTIREEKRRTEAQFWREFEAVRPLILGALLDVVSGALREYESVRIERLPRMADFAQWVTAGEISLGLKSGAFMAAYTGNRASSNDLALESSPVAAALLSFMNVEEDWQGTSSELLKALNDRTGEDVQRQPGWPKAANALSGALKRLAPNLRAAGVNVSRPRRAGKNGARIIQLERIRNSSSESSEPSNAHEYHGETCDSSRRASDDTFDTDDPVEHSSAASSAGYAAESGFSDDADDSDDLSQGFSDRGEEYGPNGETDIEAEERAAIMSEGCNRM